MAMKCSPASVVGGGGGGLSRVALVDGRQRDRFAGDRLHIRGHGATHSSSLMVLGYGFLCAVDRRMRGFRWSLPSDDRSPKFSLMKGGSR